MQQIIHGGDIYSAAGRIQGEILDFSANINPLGMPPAVLQAVQQAVAQSVHYPDPLCRRLVASLAACEEVPEEWLLCGNGAADLLFRLAFGLRPRRALLLAPTFAEYELALAAAGCALDFFPLEAGEDFAVTGRLLEAITPGIELVVLCNPNNPTGSLISPVLLRQVLARCESCGAVLLIDECFVDFVEHPEEHTLKGCLAHSRQLILLRAFTKMYAMPGLRLGYCMSSNGQLLEGMVRCGQAWSVSLPAQAAGEAALQEKSFPARTRQLVAGERAFLAGQLEGLGLRVFPSAANYLLFCSPVPLKGPLEQFGILIRGCGNYRGLDDRYYRTAVRTREDNLCLVAALGEILSRREGGNHG